MQIVMPYSGNIRDDLSLGVLAVVLACDCFKDFTSSAGDVDFRTCNVVSESLV